MGVSCRLGTSHELSARVGVIMTRLDSCGVVNIRYHSPLPLLPPFREVWPLSLTASPVRRLSTPSVRLRVDKGSLMRACCLPVRTLRCNGLP